MKQVKYYCPAVTAFDHNHEVDEQGNKNIYDFLINGGVDGIVVMGTSGEFVSMTTAQKKQLIDMSVRYYSVPMHF